MAVSRSCSSNSTSKDHIPSKDSVSKALVLTKLGDAKLSFTLEHRPIPSPGPNEVLIRIKAIGLNHAELATRLGEPNPMGPVPLPRVLGIECVGVVESAPASGGSAELRQGAVVMAALGGLGRTADGTYAEYCVAPAENVIVVASSEGELKLDWQTLGALPEMLQTAYGCLFRSLRLKKGETLLVRGATSGVGMAAIALARRAGAFVVASTRDPAKGEMLGEAGANAVVIDRDGKLVEEVRKRFNAGVDKVLDLVGAVTVGDGIQCLAEGGVCCSAGTLGGVWSVPNFIPNFMLPMGKHLTSYGERTFRKENAPWEELLDAVRDEKLRIKVGRVFEGVESIVEAHEVMERNEGGGKVVVVV
ncbi:hypothetical protein LTR09_005983 [Extremus antarcticus]|uniref:Enoyl reductase (ER) domain-containing protein n=1 Tax=Extremus antarcticus TaxID=702011 RepID=A0AAJ0DMA8_9PEZI|nr:hypothetical protein LTR09_005983 [Extremus antarcticus]